MNENDTEKYKRICEIKNSSYLENSHDMVMGKAVIESYTDPIYKAAENGILPKFMHDKRKQEELENQAYMIINNPEVEEGFRSPLNSLSKSKKEDQNKLFSSLIDRYPESSRFIFNMLNLDKVDDLGGSKKQGRQQEVDAVNYYDIIGKILEKDINGAYTLTDAQVHNFIQWYNSMMVMRRNEFSKEALEHEQQYIEKLDRQVKEGNLPEVFIERGKALDKNSEDYIRPAYHLLDTSIKNLYGYYDNKLTAELFGFEDSDINISILIAGPEELVLKTLYHEFTHAIAGDRIRFGKNKEAARILNEALSESISNIILVGKKSFGEGETYEEERKVLKRLQNEGLQEIPAEAFYDAYGEEDSEQAMLRKKARKMDFDAIETLEKTEKSGDFKEGEKHRKLKDLLLISFPECKNDKDLGKMIVRMFNEAQRDSTLAEIELLIDIFNNKWPSKPNFK